MMHRSIVSLVLALALVLGARPAHAQEKDAPLWVVVTAPDLEAPLAPLIAQRRADGMRVEVVRTTDALTDAQIVSRDGNPLRARVRKLLSEARGPRFVLLVGTYGAADPARAKGTVVPALRGARGRMAGRLTDLGYGAPTWDDMPSVAVGRFPARSAEEAKGMVEKTLLLESGKPAGAWRSRISLLVGNPGGSSLLERKFAELFIRLTLQQRLDRMPAAWSARAAVDAPGSPFTLPHKVLGEAAARMMSEGQMLTLYLGHSGWWGCSFLGRDDLRAIKLPDGGGIFYSCGCYGCQTDESSPDQEGYCLAAMRNPGGPAAVIGAYSISYAAMGLLTSDGLQKALFRPGATKRLGDVWLGVEGGIAHGEIDGATFFLYDHADGSGGEVPLEEQRREHLEMWTLLGDPALRLPVVPCSLRVSANVTAVSTTQSAVVVTVMPPGLPGLQGTPSPRAESP